MRSNNYFNRGSDIKGLILGTIYDNRAIIIRLTAGLIFLSEGIQKFLFPELTGTARFEKIGFENPAFWAYFTGMFEIVCGTFVLIGLLTRLATIPLFIIMITALLTTKIPVIAERGFWAMAHDSRTDFAMTMLLIYLFIYGAGNWSVDSVLNKSTRKRMSFRGKTFW
jgi:putative oxidoreductase